MDKQIVCLRNIQQSVPVSTETDPALPSKDAEDIPTFDEWKKIMMEVENEKSKTLC